MMVNVLQKGENISLYKLIPNLSDIIVAVKWGKKTNDKTEFNIDTSAFMLTEQNKVRNDSDFIFYNQPTANNNAIILKNNLFKIALNTIAQDINKISFVLTLHDAKQKQQHFGMLEKITIELFNFSDKQKLISYSLNYVNTETALILAVLYRYNTEWRFRAIGQGYNNGLSALAKNFGVDRKETSEPQVQNKITPITNNNKTDETVKLNTENQQTKNQVKPIINSENNSQNSKNNSQKRSKSKNKPPTPQKTSNFDIHNTDMMTKIDHYAPIISWLQQRNFQAEVNEAAMDTSGFFDEVAIELGDNYESLKRVSDTIKRRQQGKYDRAYIELSMQNQKDIAIIQKFCKQLYDYAFVTKYFYNTKDKKAVLHLQTATKIINFFNGEWLEWYAVMKVAELCHQKNIKFSCTRNMMVYLPNDNNKYEIDVFFLINDAPLFIECKSGEYREYIDKYSKLRRKLAMPKANFLMLTSGVNGEQVKGLTAMFDITFINEKMLLNYIIDTFVKKKPVAIKKPEQIDDKPLKANALTGKQTAQTLALDSLKTSDKNSSDSGKEAINHVPAIGQNHFNFKYASKPYN